MPPKPPSVLFVGINYPPESTGIAPYTGSMTRLLAARGYDCRVITAHPHYPEWRRHDGYGGVTSREVVSGVPVTRVAHYVPRYPTLVRRALSEISFGIRAMTASWNRADVVVAVSPALLSSALVLIRARLSRRRVPVVVWVQDFYGLGITETGQGGTAVARAVRAIEASVARQADAVVVIHDRFAEVAVRDLGMSPECVHTIRNWTHLDTSEGPRDRAIRESYGWRDDEVVVLHAGNMGVKQGLENVVEAARIAAAGDSRLRFVLLGDGSEKDALRRSARHLNNVSFVETLPDAEFQGMLHSADMLLVNEKPGISEMAVPSKLTSYFHAGRPVVAATDPHGITADEIRRAGAGVVVEAGDPGALVTALESLSVDPQQRTVLGDAGRRFRESTLNEESAVNSFAEIIRSVSSGPTLTRTGIIND